MKRFKFPKGIRRVNIPFILHVFTPWQDQISQELRKCAKKFGTISKRARYGYVIENGHAQIYIYKEE